MKKLLVLVILGTILYSCSNTPTESYNFSIQGQLDGEYAGKAFLYKREAGEWIKLDSALVEENTFVFKGNIDLPEIYYISIEGENRYAPLFAEQSEIFFTASIDDFGNPEISGSVSQDEYDAYKDEVAVYEARLDEIWTQVKALRDAGDADGQAELEAVYDEVDAEMKAFILDRAKQHNATVISAYTVIRNAYYYDETDLEPVVTNFDPSIDSSIYVKQLSKRVKTLKSVAIGQPAVDFSMTDIEGNPLQLSSLYGKYILVDFWASWCGPCRRENPNVVAAYQDFNEKGFDILGVSFDKDRSKWIEAVRVDNLTWHQVSDLKGWGNEAGKLYAVNSIPANILLDPEGKIIAKNLRGEDLLAKLQELLND